MKKILNGIRFHMKNTESDHRSIVLGFLWVSLFVMIGKTAGALKEMVIAWRYGVSSTVDAYVFVMNLVGWPISVWFGILSVVLIPLAAKIKSNSALEFSKFRSEILGLTILVGLGISGIYYFALPYLLRIDYLGLTGDTVPKAILMACPLSFVIAIGLIVSLFSVWTMAGGAHKNTLYEAIPALAIAAAIGLPSTYINEPLVFGTLIGFAIQAAALGLYVSKTSGWQPPKYSLNSCAWSGFWSGFGIIAFGQFSGSLVGIVDQIVAAELGPGKISTLGYSNRILSLLLGLGATAIGRATLPVFSNVVAHGTGDVKSLSIKWAKWMLLAGIFLTAIIAFASDQIVSVIYQRGAFTQEDSRIVAEILRQSISQVPFYFCGLVFVSALGATRRYSVIAFTGVSNLAIKIAFAYPMAQYFGLAGLVYSTSAMYAISATILYVSVLRSDPRTMASKVKRQ